MNYSDEMVSWICSTRKNGFQFVCKKYRKEKNFCKTTLDALENTGIPFRDILAIIFYFVLKTPTSFCLNQICSWRKYREEKVMHSETTDYYSFCWEICEVVVLQDCHKLGRIRKTISVDKTFLTSGKYHKGKMSESRNITVLENYC